MPRRQMTPEDIPTIVVVEELDLSVDGRTAVVVRRSIKGNRYLGHLYAIDLGSGRAIPRPRQLSTGAIRDTKPRICPDGRTIAFVRTDPTDDDSVAAIGVLDLDRPQRIRTARSARSPGRPTAAGSHSRPRSIRPASSPAGRARSRGAVRRKGRMPTRRSRGTSPAPIGA